MRKEWAQRGGGVCLELRGWDAVRPARGAPILMGLASREGGLCLTHRGWGHQVAWRHVDTTGGLLGGAAQKARVLPLSGTRN